MSSKLIADLMSFRARMVADNRTQLMFEGDFDTIDQAIAQLRAARQSSQSEPVAVFTGKFKGNVNGKQWIECELTGAMPNTGDLLYAAPQRAIPNDEAVTHLWECLGIWSAYLVANGEQAELAPPDWLSDAIYKATAAPQQAIPSGWRIVPIEPTEEMIKEGLKYKAVGGGVATIYQKMLSASPSAPIERDK
jgi:hypothetical protein